MTVDGTRACHSLAADLDLVGTAVAAGNTVGLVPFQAEDADALAKGAKPGHGAGFLGGLGGGCQGIPPLSLLLRLSRYLYHECITQQ